MCFIPPKWARLFNNIAVTAATVDTIIMAARRVKDTSTLFLLENGVGIVKFGNNEPFNILFFRLIVVELRSKGSLSSEEEDEGDWYCDDVAMTLASIPNSVLLQC